MVEVRTRQGMDLMATASWIASEINRRRPDRVRVDSIGLGAGLVDRLREIGHSVEAVNVSERADAPDLFVNRRAEIAWKFREALERGDVSLPDDDALIAELSAFQYDYDSKGRIKLELKDQTRRVLGRSPDKADACLLGFAAASRGPGRYGLFGSLVIDFEKIEVVERIEWDSL